MTMTTETILFLIAFVVGNIALAVSVNRVRTTRIMQDQLIRVADGLWQEAAEANQQQSESLVKIHNQILELAALAPAIVARVVVAREDTSMTQKEKDEIENFLNRNAWVLPYIFTSYLALHRLRFHARPWSPRLAYFGATSWFVMAFLFNEDGTVKYSKRPRETTQQVEEFVKLDTSRHAENLISAH